MFRFFHPLSIVSISKTLSNDQFEIVKKHKKKEQNEFSLTNELTDWTNLMLVV